jgi:5-methylcytosine-specific restriction protein B
MLIEHDKRDRKTQLLYVDEKFSIPKNIHIIGTMNTADRSLAMLDYALRHRFAFIDMEPAFESDGFIEYMEKLDNPKFDSIINCVKSLNTAISDDASLGEGFRIGHSYFCGLPPETVTEIKLSSIIEYELIPLLKEYWFDEPDKVRDWSANLRGAIK